MTNDESGKIPSLIFLEISIKNLTEFDHEILIRLEIFWLEVLFAYQKINDCARWEIGGYQKKSLSAQAR